MVSMNTKDKTEKTCKNCYFFYKNEINYYIDCRYYGEDDYFKPLIEPIEEKKNTTNK